MRKCDGVFKNEKIIIHLQQDLAGMTRLIFVRVSFHRESEVFLSNSPSSNNNDPLIRCVRNLATASSESSVGNRTASSTLKSFKHCLGSHLTWSIRGKYTVGARYVV